MPTAKKMPKKQWNHRFYADSALESKQQTLFPLTSSKRSRSRRSRKRPKSVSSSRSSEFVTAKHSRAAFKKTLKRIHSAKYNGATASVRPVASSRSGNSSRSDYSGVKSTSHILPHIAEQGSSNRNTLKQKRRNPLKQHRSASSLAGARSEQHFETRAPMTRPQTASGHYSTTRANSNSASHSRPLSAASFVSRNQSQNHIAESRAQANHLRQDQQAGENAAESQSLSIYQFEQLKERIIALWKGLKFSPADREAFSLFFYSTKYAYILQDHYINLLRFKDRTLDVLKLVQIREGKRKELLSNVEHYYSLPPQDAQMFLQSREVRLHVATRMGELRATSLEIVDAIQRWRGECLTRRKPYIWNASNYLLKMETDLEFFLQSPLISFIPDLITKLNSPKVDLLRVSRFASLPPLEWIEQEAQRRGKIKTLIPTLDSIHEARHVILQEREINEEVRHHSTRGRGNEREKFSPSLSSQLNREIMSHLKQFKEFSSSESEDAETDDSAEEENVTDANRHHHSSTSLDISNAIEALDEEVSRINTSSSASHLVEEASANAQPVNTTLNLALVSQSQTENDSDSEMSLNTPDATLFSHPSTSFGNGSSSWGKSSRTNGTVSSLSLRVPESHEETMRLIDDALKAKKENNRRRSERTQREKVNAAAVSSTFRKLMISETNKSERNL